MSANQHGQEKKHRRIISANPAHVSVFLQGYGPVVVRVVHVEQNCRDKRGESWASVCVCVFFFLLVCFLLLFDFGALTSQLLPPEVLSLLFTHVE